MAGAATIFVNDQLNAGAAGLAASGTAHIALRSAGSITSTSPPHASGHVARARVRRAVAEHAVALMMTRNHKLHRAYHRVRDGSFTLDGLLGFDMHGRTAAIVGTGKIGAAVSGILRGFGCQLLAHDVPRTTSAGPRRHLCVVATISGRA
jgi:D-lactate dehydrogenase